MKFEIELTGATGKRKHIVELARKGDAYAVTLDGLPVEADAVQIAPNTISIILAGQSFEFHLFRSADGAIKLQCGPHEFSAEINDPRA